MLGEPALFAREIGTNTQSKTFFTQQNVTAVTGANGDDCIVLRKMTDEPALRIDIKQGVHPTVPLSLRIVAKAFHRNFAHASHDPHIEHDIF